MSGKRYRINELKDLLRNYILALGRVPTQSEVRQNPRLPSDETFLNIYPTWEDAVMAAGFTLNWCSPELRRKMLLDLQKKYLDMGYKLPGPQDIQNDPKMEKVCVYVQVFGDLDYAKRAAGIWQDYRERQQKEIINTILRLKKELGRTPKIRDKGMPNDKLIKKVFGSCEEALRAAGLEPNYRNFDRKQLIGQLKKKYLELKRSPRAAEISDDPKMASLQTFRRVFGSYSKALKAARLPPAPAEKGYHYTEEELILQLKTKYSELGCAPTTKDVNSDPWMASDTTFIRKFGSFKTALEIAEIPTRQARSKYRRDELIEQLVRKSQILGRPPRQKEVEQDREMASVNTFTNKFGSFSAALEAAGMRINKKREYTDAELLDDLEKKYIAIGYLKTGRRPTNKEINADPEMASTRAYDRHFGTTNKARKLVEERLS